MKLYRTIKRASLTLGITAALATALVSPVAAEGVVTQAITAGAAGARTASIADMTLGSLGYSHAVQQSAGALTLTMEDATGTNVGWNVTTQTSPFVYSGANNGTNIPAANFSLTSANAPVMTAGQAVSATDGPMVPATSPVGTLDSARKVVQANAGFGKGAYTQGLGVNLEIPAYSAAGTYTGTLTTTISAAP